MHSVNLAEASPENFTFRTFKAFRSSDAAIKTAKMRKGKIRLMDLRQRTHDYRDVYFVVSFAGNYHDSRVPKEMKRRKKRIGTEIAV